jgi:hypothetical protein
MHKTGTSSIQQSLNGFANDEFAYADFGGGPNHGRALFNLVGSAGADRARARERIAAGRRGAVRSTSAGARSALGRAIKSAGRRTLLLSAEGTLFLSVEELRELRAVLSAELDEIGIVAYVRPPAAYLGSMVQQLIKGGSLQEFNAERGYPNYRRSLEKFDEVFGREHVRLWKFDPAVFPEGCVVRDFCRRLGINVPGERIVHVNESLSREALGLLYTYRRLSHGSHSVLVKGADKTRLVEQVAGIGNTRFRLAPDVVRPILERNRTDIEWMEARLGQPLAEELGAARAGDVVDERDLLTPDARAVAQLRELLGEPAPAGLRGETPTPEEIARMIGVLAARERGGNTLRRRDAPLQQARSPERPATRLAVADACAGLEQSLPAGFAPERAQALVQAVFRHINDELAATGEGVVTYAGLGQFRVRRLDRPGGGRNGRTRIVFRSEDASRQA